MRAGKGSQVRSCDLVCYTDNDSTLGRLKEDILAEISCDLQYCSTLSSAIARYPLVLPLHIFSPGLPSSPTHLSFPFLPSLFAHPIHFFMPYLASLILFPLPSHLFTASPPPSCSVSHLVKADILSDSVKLVQKCFSSPDEQLDALTACSPVSIVGPLASISLAVLPFSTPLFCSLYPPPGFPSISAVWGCPAQCYPAQVCPLLAQDQWGGSNSRSHPLRQAAKCKSPWSVNDPFNLVCCWLSRITDG